MAKDIMKAVGTCRLTRDPEETRGGATKMRVAWSSMKKTENGYEDKSNYIDVITYGTTGESCLKFLKKGSRVAIDGDLSYGEWETPKGEKRSTIQINGRQVQFLDSKPKEEFIREGASSEDIPF